MADDVNLDSTGPRPPDSDPVEIDSPPPDTPVETIEFSDDEVDPIEPFDTGGLLDNLNDPGYVGPGIYAAPDNGVKDEILPDPDSSGESDDLDSEQSPLPPHRQHPPHKEFDGEDADDPEPVELDIP